MRALKVGKLLSLGIYESDTKMGAHSIRWHQLCCSQGSCSDPYVDIIQHHATPTVFGIRTHVNLLPAA